MTLLPITNPSRDLDAFYRQAGNRGDVVANVRRRGTGHLLARVERRFTEDRFAVRVESHDFTIDDLTAVTAIVTQRRRHGTQIRV